MEVATQGNPLQPPPLATPRRGCVHGLGEHSTGPTDTLGGTMRAPTPLVALAVLAACATVPTQTKFMEQQGVTVSSEAIRTRLRAEAVPFTGLMEQAADAARDASPDPAVRRRALVWKLNVVPALYRTLFNQRPLVALLDTWALLLQAEAYLESSEGKAAFGPGVADVLATTRELELRLQEIARWAAPDRDLAKVRASVQGWAEKHPVRLTFATRDSIEQFLATIAPTEELSAFAVIGRMNEDIGGLISRMDFLPVMVPNQVTWQAELAYVDLIDPRLAVALQGGQDALARVDDLLAWLDGGVDALADRQRVALVQAISAERIEIERILEGQRSSIQSFVNGERIAILEQLRQERIAIMADAQRLTDHATEEATKRAKEIVDHALLRVAWILGAVLIVALAGGFLLRRRAQPAPPQSG